MESVYIVLIVLIIMGTVFEMHALYMGAWRFPIWYIGGIRRSRTVTVSSVLGMSLLAYGLWITYDWVLAILSLLAYIFVYIALCFYITTKAPREVYREKGTAFLGMLVTIGMFVIMFYKSLKDSQAAEWMTIIYSLFNIFFLFLPLYYLFKIRLQKLEERSQQEKEIRQQEEERRKKEERKKMRSWAVVTKEINTNSKTEEEQ